MHATAITLIFAHRSHRPTWVDNSKEISSTILPHGSRTKSHGSPASNARPSPSQGCKSRRLLRRRKLIEGCPSTPPSAIPPQSLAAMVAHLASNERTSGVKFRSTQRFASSLLVSSKSDTKLDTCARFVMAGAKSTITYLRYLHKYLDNDTTVQ